jgi:hypothetical protein
MKLRLLCLLPAVLIVASASASAAGALTPQECNAYPFVPLTGPVTHQDLMRELSLLESVGYQPSVEDFDYPHDLMRAIKRLNVKYLAECAHAPAQ